MRETGMIQCCTRLLKPADVATRLGISIRQLWRLAAADQIPRPVRIGMRGTRWRESDVAEYLFNL